MRMNVQPIPTISDKSNEIRHLSATIVNKEILPNENMLWAWRDGGRFGDSEIEEARLLREDIKRKVKGAGLWASHLHVEYGGAGLDFIEHAYMNEVKSPALSKVMVLLSPLLRMPVSQLPSFAVALCGASS